MRGQVHLGESAATFSLEDTTSQQHAPFSTLLLRTPFCGTRSQGTCPSLSRVHRGASHHQHSR